MTLPLVLAVLAYSIILHEVMHGVAAAANGDLTARRAGRLTLNPLPHVDVLGTLVLPGLLLLVQAPFLIGWAKPVPFDPTYFRHRRSGIVSVALAGPATNVALAALFAALYRPLQAAGSPLTPVMLYGTALNVMLALFNLLPLPPLDGSKVLAVLLPAALRRRYFALERWGFVLVLALLYTGVLGRVLLPIYRRILGALLSP